MGLSYKTPSIIGDDYLGILKALKPEVNIDQQDSDWWIRSRVLGGVTAGVYADQQKVGSDIFPQTARSEAIDKHLETYGIGPRKSAAQAAGSVAVTGNVGTVYTVGLNFKHDPTGNQYSVDTTVTLSATAGSVNVTSVGTGQAQNLLSGTTLSMPAPPVGHQAAVVTLMADGRDAETDAEAASRVLTRIQSPISGGTKSDYEQWALEANAAVTSASVIRFPKGPGTVAVYFTAGTTDIDTAINNNQAIVRVPSQQLITDVQNYIDGKRPITDCVEVKSVSEIPLDVSVRVKYLDGLNGSSIITGQTLTLNQLVAREVSRALYKIPVGGRQLGGSGFVFASEIEEVIDIGLSSDLYTVGAYAQVVVDREVYDLAATGPNRRIGVNEIVMPGTVTVVEG